MTILEALKNKQIRYGAGRHFDATTKPGENLWVENMSELPGLLKQEAESHAGSVFVTFGEELPANVPTNNPEHTWAWALQVGRDHKQVGAVVIWSTDEHEGKWRAGRHQDNTFDEFNVRRHGHE